MTNTHTYRRLSWPAALIGLCLLAAAGGVQARCADLPSGLENAPRAPQNTGRAVIGKTYDEIIDRGSIEIGVYDDFPPYSYRVNGKPAGIDVDVGRLIAESLRLKADFVFLTAGENVDADLRNYVWKGPIIGGRMVNLMMHVPYDRDFACRNEQVKLTGQYFQEELAIAYRKDRYPDAVPVPAYFRYDQIGVENDSIADFYLASLARGQILPNIVRFADPQRAKAAMTAGAIPAVMAPRGQLEHALPPEIAVHAPTLPAFSVGRWTLGVAVRHTNRDLGYDVDYAIEKALASGAIQTIFDKYGVSFRSPDR